MPSAWKKCFVVTMQAVSGRVIRESRSMTFSAICPVHRGRRRKDGRRTAEAACVDAVGRECPLRAHAIAIPVVKTDTSRNLSPKLEKIATLGEVREALRNFTVNDELAALLRR